MKAKTYIVTTTCAMFSAAALASFLCVLSFV